MDFGRGNGTVLWIAETWLWLLCNELTFIQSSAFVGIFFNFIILINARSVERFKLMLYYFRIGHDRFLLQSVSILLFFSLGAALPV